MTDETTSEQLAEIDRQPEPVQVREGRWRTRNGLVRDVTAMPKDHEDFAAAYPWWDGVSTWRNDGRWLAGGSTMDLLEYLGPIEQDKTQELPTKTQELPDKTQELETKTQELPEYTPPEGWRVLAVGEVLRDGDMWVWPTNDQLRQTVHVGAVVGANQRYIRPIEPQPQPQPEPQPESGTELQAQVAFLKGREVTLGTRLQQEKEVTTRLRSEVSYVQRLLGESRQRVTQLEKLVASLRTINEAQEKSFNAANKANDDLQHRLNVVAAEWAEQAETIRRLQIELDAAQQVPQAIADRFEEGWNQGTARAVETVLEWLEPIRLVDSAYLANATMQHLPQIMRSLTGLNDEEIE